MVLVVVMTLLALLSAALFVRVNQFASEQAKLPVKAMASLMFVLLGFAAVSYAGAGTYSILVVIALICGLAGDVLLQIMYCRGENGGFFFRTGVIAFLLGHAAYIGAFACRAPMTWLQPAVLAGVLIAVFAALKVMKADFGEQKWLVYVYAAVIALMLGWAVKLSAQMWYVSVGAVLFVISDLILAVIMFTPVRAKWLPTANLITYYGAQILLALSALA